jgi:hypothetical protein
VEIAQQNGALNRGDEQDQKDQEEEAKDIVELVAPAP